MVDIKTAEQIIDESTPLLERGIEIAEKGQIMLLGDIDSKIRFYLNKKYADVQQLQDFIAKQRLALTGSSILGLKKELFIIANNILDKLEKELDLRNEL